MLIEQTELPAEWIITAVYGRKVTTYIIVSVSERYEVNIRINHKCPEELIDAR